MANNRKKGVYFRFGLPKCNKKVLDWNRSPKSLAQLSTNYYATLKHLMNDSRGVG